MSKRKKVVKFPSKKPQPPSPIGPTLDTFRCMKGHEWRTPPNMDTWLTVTSQETGLSFNLFPGDVCPRCWEELLAPIRGKKTGASAQAPGPTLTDVVAQLKELKAKLEAQEAPK